MAVSQNEIAIFGSGCFWCTEAVFERLRGVVSVAPGYAGGHTPNPTYEEVSRGTSGHAETARIEYDPSLISYRDLLEVFFATHDPTAKNRQGNDIGEQYRSAIFITSPEQQRQAHDIVVELERGRVFASPIVTEVKPLDVFYEAEDYHRKFYGKNPNQLYCQFVIAPKLKKFKDKFKALLKV